jgi:hypothetical protein
LTVVDAPTKTIRIVLGAFSILIGGPLHPISFVTNPSGVVAFGGKR